MKKLLLAIGALILALGPFPTKADVLFPALGAAGAVSGTDILACYQGTEPVLGCTSAQLDTYFSQTTKTLTNKTLTTPTIAGGALSGTFSGNFTLSGVPTLSGLSSGTIATCAGFATASTVLISGTCPGGGGGSLTVTDGTHSVASTTTLTVGNGFLVGGSAGSATLNSTTTLDTQSGTGAFAIPSTDAGATILRTNASGGADTIANATGAFGAGFSTVYTTTAFAGNTITPATATINGLSVLKLGSYQFVEIDSDGTNYHAALGLPQPATQTGTTYLADDFTWKTTAIGANPTATAGTSANNGSATTFMRSDASPAIASATTSVLGIAKQFQAPISIGWVAGVSPNNTILLADAVQALTIQAINGRPEVALGATGTVDVYDAPSGTACSAGTKVTTSSFNANGTAATNQTLLSSPYALAAGHSLCLQVTGATWGAGASVATISAYGNPS